MLIKPTKKWRCPNGLDDIMIPYTYYRLVESYRDADGRTKVKRYNDGSLGPKYLTIFETAHGQVKMTREHSRKNPNRGCVKVEFRFPKAYPLELTKQLYREESEEVNAFLMTRKTNTLWINNND